MQAGILVLVMFSILRQSEPHPFVKASAEVPGACNQDTITLAQSTAGIRITKESPFSSTMLQTVEKHLFDSSKNYCLFLKGVEIRNPPEGVYEIYLSSEKIKPDQLVSTNKYFVNVMDTYGEHRNGKISNICLKVIRSLTHQYTSGRYLRNFYFTILFRGNKTNGNKPSKEAGTLLISQVKLIQTN